MNDSKRLALAIPFFLIMGMVVGFSLALNNTQATPASGFDTLQKAFVVCDLDDIADPSKLPTTLEQTSVALYTLTNLTPQQCTLRFTDLPQAPSTAIRVTLIWND